MLAFVSVAELHRRRKSRRGFDENEVVADRVVRELCPHGRALPPPAGDWGGAAARATACMKLGLLDLARLK